MSLCSAGPSPFRLSLGFCLSPFTRYLRPHTPVSDTELEKCLSCPSCQWSCLVGCRSLR
jgi:hypothetical protein